MSTTIRSHRTRAALALTTVALLGLGACSGTDGADGGGDGTTPEASTTSTEAASDGGADGSGDDADATDDTNDSDDSEGAGEDEGTMGASERTRIALRIDLGVDGGSGEGALRLGADELAALLADPLGGAAECDGELVLEPGAETVGCTGPAGMESADSAQDWVASTVLVPGQEDPRAGAQVAVLFTTGTEFPDDAEELREESVSVTGLGFGSMFGAEPLDAEQLAESTLQTLTSEHAYVPAAGMAGWEEVTCEDGLDFTEFETVDCTASTGEGEDWPLHVAPGSFVDNDQGLLVGIEDPARD
ncbi:hypothetical protein [Brachybacterium saurashtrense]|uniref:hypothetical protein n=1 Tax=Brachybacterium saurashtrense TaxID=556288 RepID=UPI0013B41BB1|nr:hypothetical protein [Brachybacterium saurashtrense]